MHASHSRDLKPGSAPLAVVRGNAGLVGAADALDGKVWQILGQSWVTKAASENSLSWYALIPPGVSMPPHVHLTRDQQIYVLDGSLTVSIDGREAAAGGAGLVHVPRGSVSAFANRGARPVHAMFFISPARGLSMLFDKLSGVSDPAAIAKLAAGHDVTMIQA